MACWFSGKIGRFLFFTSLNLTCIYGILFYCFIFFFYISHRQNLAGVDIIIIMRPFASILQEIRILSCEHI